MAWKTHASCPCQDAILCLRSSEIWQVRSGLRLSRVPVSRILEKSQDSREELPVSQARCLWVLFSSLGSLSVPEPLRWGSLLKHLLQSRIRQPSLGTPYLLPRQGSQVPTKVRGTGLWGTPTNLRMIFRVPHLSLASRYAYGNVPKVRGGHLLPSTHHRMQWLFHEIIILLSQRNFITYLQSFPPPKIQSNKLTFSI